MSSQINTFQNPASITGRTFQSGQPISLASLTFDTLIEFHKKRLSINSQGKARSPQGLKNLISGVNSWLRANKLDRFSTVGEKLTVSSSFKASLAEFLKDLKEVGKSYQTIRDRKSQVEAFRESYIEYAKLSKLSGKFAERLRFIVENSGKTVEAIAKAADISPGSIYGWMKGEHYPSSGTLKQLHSLEDVLKVDRGTLTSTLPDVLFSAKEKFETCTTGWRAHQRLLTSFKYRYRLNVFKLQLKEEWECLLDCQTDPDYAESLGLVLYSEWRIRPETRVCPTGDRVEEMLKSFFGRLALAPDEADPMRNGKGLENEFFTLGLLGVANLVDEQLQFMKDRSYKKSYHTGHYSFLDFCSQLLRPEEGYLWQQPKFGLKLKNEAFAELDLGLPDKIDAESWHVWCEENLDKLSKIRRRINREKKRKNKRGNKNKDGKKADKAITRFRSMGRDPFEPLLDIILHREVPLSALWDVAEALESLTPLLRQGSPDLLGINQRHTFQTRLVSSNPLRVEQFSMMTAIPKDWGYFEKLCELYANRDLNQPVDFSKYYFEASEESNLYMLPDGSFRLRFNSEDFKTDQGEPLEPGMLDAPYDVKVLEPVRQSLFDYLFGGRVILNRCLKEDLNRLREKHGLPLLTEAQELAIDRCGYVFRPDKRQLNKKSKEWIAKYTGTERTSTRALSLAMRRLTQKYIPRCPGFGMHACRHLAASSYVKSDPDGAKRAAGALHITEATAEKHYAWISSADRKRPFDEYYLEQYKIYKAGGTQEASG